MSKRLLLLVLHRKKVMEVLVLPTVIAPPARVVDPIVVAVKENPVDALIVIQMVIVPVVLTLFLILFCDCIIVYKGGMRYEGLYNGEPVLYDLMCYKTVPEKEAIHAMNKAREKYAPKVIEKTQIVCPILMVQMSNKLEKKSLPMQSWMVTVALFRSMLN